LLTFNREPPPVADPVASASEPSDPFGGDAFAGPSTQGAPDPFGGAPAAEDPFGDPFGGGGDPFGGDDIRDEVARVSKKLGRRLTFLVGKPGLDGHSNGAEQIAVRARDCGMEVVYEGIRLTPERIAALRRSGVVG